MKTKNRRVVLARRPEGEPKRDDFRFEELDTPSIGEGQILAKTLYLSLDPYMRGRMSEGPSYAPPLQIGDVITGGAVCEVLESRSARLHPGDIVVGMPGWQEYAALDASGVRKVDPNLAPISTAVGVLGMPGMTAYVGLRNIGKPKAGETLVVAAASGAVGSVVGQIARINGARAVGIAGGPEKCDFVVKELGFDACVDHRSRNFENELKAACPDGIDVYFENVGGHVLEAVLPLMNLFGRIPICGTIAHYNETEPPPGPNQAPALMRLALRNRLTLRGFLVFDFAEQEADFLREMSGWIREGKVKYREDVVDGLENAIEAFQGLLTGKNFGKLVVKVS